MSKFVNALQLRKFLYLLSIIIILIFFSSNLIFAEGNLQMSGEIQINIAEDHNFGIQSKDYTLIADKTNSFRLFFNDQPKNIKSGQFVFVRGSWVTHQTLGEGILVDELIVSSSAYLENSIQSTTRKVLIIVVNFSDTSASCSNTAAANLMWDGTNSIASWFNEASFGVTSFPSDTNADSSPDAVNVTIGSAMGSSCNYNTWANAADTLAESAGYDLSQYDHRVYILPETAPCDWAGLGTLGCGSYCRAWTLYCNLADVLAHEIGHNLDLNHAGVDTDNDGSTEDEYGDTSCVMGYGGVGYRHFNSVHKVDLGWIPSDRIQNATTAGSYALFSLEEDPSTVNPTPSTQIQVVRAGVPGTSDDYYFSYRIRTGDFSDNLPGSFRNKISVHRTSGDTYSYLVTTIAEGEEFNDGNGTVISNISAESNHVTFTLSATGGGGSDDNSSYSVSGTITKDAEEINSNLASKLRIILRNLSSNAVYRTTINSDGTYRLNNVPAGSYRYKLKRVKTNIRPKRIYFRNSAYIVDSNETLDFDI